MAKSKTASRAAAAWNDRYPVGTPVRYWPILGGRYSQRGVTTSAAEVIGGKTFIGVVLFTVKKGYVELAHVMPAEKGGE